MTEIKCEISQNDNQLDSLQILSKITVRIIPLVTSHSVQTSFHWLYFAISRLPVLFCVVDFFSLRSGRAADCESAAALAPSAVQACKMHPKYRERFVNNRCLLFVIHHPIL